MTVAGGAAIGLAPPAKPYGEDMDTRTIRTTTVALPGDEPDDLDPYDTIPASRSAVVGATVTGTAWTRATLSGVRISRTWVIDADLSGAQVDGGTWDRVALRGCSLVGATLHDLTLRNVLFDNCRLDYATLIRVRATGPVAFVGCSLTDTHLEGGKLPDSVFDNCRFADTQLDGIDLHGADLRGNDLAGLLGITSTKGATIGSDQLSALAAAVIRDLELTVRD